MATKDTLEPREGDCKTTEDFVALAREAMEDPADNEYAGELVDKAELAAQMPGDYIATAEVAVALGNEEGAADLYEQAEDACFEPSEKAMLAHSMATVLGDKAKAKELLADAADEAKDLADLLTISRYAREDCEDEELAKTLLGKVEEGCKTLEEYKTLARTVIAGDRATAETFYRKAEVLCDGASEMIAFAEGILEVFEDTAWANETLEEVEGDAQFTKDFIALAEFHHRSGNAEKVGEMMEQAGEYAMTGEENVMLAEAAWKLLGDKDAAVEGYRKALGEIDDKDQLIALAKTVMTELENPELAKEVYARYESKLTGAPDAVKLARAVKDDLGDLGLAGEIYDRAEAAYDTPADALTLAGGLLADLEDSAAAGRLYGRALDGTREFGPLMKLLDTARAGVDDVELARSILAKAAGVAVSPPQLLQTADKVMEILEDREMTAGLLDQAEEKVTSLDEMKKVVAAVEKYLADDSDRVTRVQEKLEKREANQGLYKELQATEAELTRFHEFLRLADRVMAELDDTYYAAKLLREAETRLTDSAFSVPGYTDLAMAVQKHLGDADEVSRILDDAVARTHAFGDRRELCRVAASGLGDLGREKVRGFHEAWEVTLEDGEGGASPYDLAKLAGAVREDLGDDVWAGRLLEGAEAKASDSFELAHLAKLQAAAGDDGKAGALRERAVASCASPDECGRLVGRLRTDRVPDETIRTLYRSYGEGLTAPADRLRWAEGILDLWRDEAWAKDVYRKLRGAMASGSDKARFDASVQFRFDGKL
jgi:hypothetical protein